MGVYEAQISQFESQSFYSEGQNGAQFLAQHV